MSLSPKSLSYAFKSIKNDENFNDQNRNEKKKKLRILIFTIIKSIGYGNKAGNQKVVTN